MVRPRSGIAARGGSVGDEAAEEVATLREPSVERVGDATTHACVADERSVSPHEAPAREAFGLGQPFEERLRRNVVEREDREALAAVDTRDDTRRESAEASGRVVEEDRAA